MDLNSDGAKSTSGSKSPLVWGRGSKQDLPSRLSSQTSRPSFGGVDLNMGFIHDYQQFFSRPSFGGVDLNNLTMFDMCDAIVAPRLGAWI